MLAARARKLTMFVHAVDDFGSLCGARPAKKKWVATESLPITCPRCLWSMSRTRYAVCRAPTETPADWLHIREVGPEGMRKYSGVGAVRTLCGRHGGWDVSVVSAEAVRSHRMCAACRLQFKLSAETRERELFAGTATR